MTFNKLHYKENVFQLKSLKNMWEYLLSREKVFLSDSFLACELELAHPVASES